MFKNFHKLMLLTSGNGNLSSCYLNFIKHCASSGITSVQMREKTLDYKAAIVFGKELKKVLDDLNIPLIINDNLDLAVELNAYGLHLGKSDGSIIEARKMLGADKIIGFSVGSLADALFANSLPIDYIGCGAIFPTLNKPDALVLGLENLKQIVQVSKSKVVAIGGISLENFGAILKVGTVGIAGIDLFHKAEDVQLTISTIMKANHG